MPILCRTLLSCLLIFTSTVQAADYFELGLAGNYRKIHLSDSNTSQKAFDENYAYVASAAYYFREMTALEFNYSIGRNTRSIPSSTLSSKTVHDYSMYGVDLVFSFGKRGDQFVPYIKGGLAYFDKKDIKYEYVDHANGGNTFTESVSLKPTVVPSAGLGMQFKISEELYFKTGVEFWTSGPVNKDLGDFDWAGRVGISWFI
jgi:hypothetical protein